MTLYYVHGLRVLTELSLPVAADASGAQPDLELIVTERRAISRRPPPGRAVARAGNERRGYAAVRTPGLVIRVFGVAEFSMAEGSSLMEVAAAPEASLELVALLFAGVVCSLLVVEGGQAALHASAVVHAGGCIAFAGATGAGKSTLAGLACAEGARLLTDDLLSIDVSPPVAHPGTSALRLRDGAATVAEALKLGQARSADGRLVVSPTPAVDAARLTAIVLPRPSRYQEHAVFESLSGAEALRSLLAASRAQGLVERALLESQFHVVSELVRQVPIKRVALPWGPPFSDGLFADLVSRVTTSA